MSIHKEADIFRHTPVRYLGYANEIGEAFRYHIKLRTLVFAYVLSTGYIVGDTLDKGIKSYKKITLKNKENNINTLKNDNLNIQDNNDKIQTKNDSPLYHVIKSGGFCLCWQILATELVPAFIVFQVVKITKKLIGTNRSPFIIKWVPTLAGLCLIPTFPHTVDPLIDNLFDLFKMDLDREVY